MNKQTVNKLYIIAGIGFAIAGIIFLCLSIFTEPKNNTYLCIALVSTTVSNLLNIIRAQKGKTKSS